jgi:hypothetical protein
MHSKEVAGVLILFQVISFIPDMRAVTSITWLRAGEKESSDTGKGMLRVSMLPLPPRTVSIPSIMTSDIPADLLRRFVVSPKKERYQTDETEMAEYRGNRRGHKAQTSFLTAWK